MQVVKIEMKCARCRSQWIANSRSSLAVDSFRVDPRLALLARVYSVTKTRD
jgi:cytochrome c-type biogenesis protein CcmH/NrfF